MYQNKTYQTFRQITASYQALIKAVYGLEVQLQAKIADKFSLDLFVEDCQQITAWVNRAMEDLKIQTRFKRIDSYYIALQLCLDKYPFIKDETFALAFGKERTTVNKARKKIAEIMEIDPQFVEAYTQIKKYIDAPA